MKGPRFKLWAQLGLGVLLFLLLLYLCDVSQLSRLPEIHWVYVLMLFLSTLGFTLSHNIRWKEIVENVSKTKVENFFSLYRYLVNSYALGTIIPMDISLLGLRSYYLNRFHNMSISMAIFSVLLDRLLDLLVFLMMVVPSFLFITRVASANQSLSIMMLFLAGLFLLIFRKKGNTFNFLFEIYRIFLVRWISKVPLLGHRITEGVDEKSVDCHFSQASVIQIIAWNFIKYIFLSLRFYFTGQALGIPFPLVKSFFFLPIVQFSLMINVTPAGLGVLEMGTYGALLIMGIPTSQILIFVIGQRILLFFVLLSLLVLNHLILYIPSLWRRWKGLEWKG